MTEDQIHHNRMYISLAEHALGIESYYFSYDYDLTHTLQRLDNTSPDFVSMCLAERADARFVWNQHLLKDFHRDDLSKFSLPLMLGFVVIKQVVIKNHCFSYALISRRSCHRAGTRYYMRGLDVDGNSANYVETEQLIECEGYRASFVQTRGSIPLVWSQRPNLKYKPTPQISQSQNHSNAFQKHFATQLFSYGKQVLINLIDHKGAEKELENSFRQLTNSSKNPDIRYEAFDFHQECSKMRWHRLSILLDRLEEERKMFKFFAHDKDGRTVIVQDGVFRTNCIDCLDRTNVVQSLLARRTLQDQLVKFNILQEGERVEDQLAFETVFKNVWADNADACAKQYAGTGALKTDFTRTGKRTKMGLMKDGVNSAIRYVKNNFYDGFRQDAVDLILGNHQVDEGECATTICPLQEKRDIKFYILPAIFCVAFSMLLVSFLVGSDHSGEHALYLAFWIMATAVTGGLIYYYGTEFVDKPKLVQTKNKLD
ncbi:DgyrCDS8199 [Dimorphilus gyrociliatus]|nr:DgyrCDS8199 [Dimorphilus gyrociliatus]